MQREKVRKTFYQRFCQFLPQLVVDGAMVEWYGQETEVSFYWLESPGVTRPPVRWGFYITLRHTTLGRTRLDEWSARPVAETSTWQHTTSMPPAGFEHSNPGQRAAADPRLRPRDHWDRRKTEVLQDKNPVPVPLCLPQSNMDWLEIELRRSRREAGNKSRYDIMTIYLRVQGASHELYYF